jgi:hypothetical protein
VANPDNPAISEPPRPPGGAREAIVIGLAFLTFVGLGWWWMIAPSPVVERFEPAKVDGIDPSYANYVGDAACSRCHPGESAAHSRSGHARTLRPVDRSPVGRTMAGRKADDPEWSGVAWEFATEDGKLVTRRVEGDGVDRRVVDYAFGSGRHATTFVTVLDHEAQRPSLLEHRLTFFAHAKGLGLTPGLSKSAQAAGNSPIGRVHEPGDAAKCFACHTTVNSNRGQEVLDERTMIPNVSCERCHGPGRSHVEAARTGAGLEALRMPEGPGSWTAAEQMEQCGQCHRTPATVRPGSIRTDNPILVRHQPVGLTQSECYLRSNGAMSCVTCHDPHARASTDRASYETSCLSCHKSPRQTPCPVSPTSGCLDCHMPRRDVARGMLMTDHWIRKRP